MSLGFFLLIDKNIAKIQSFFFIIPKIRSKVKPWLILFYHLVVIFFLLPGIIIRYLNRKKMPLTPYCMYFTSIIYVIKACMVLILLNLNVKF